MFQWNPTVLHCPCLLEQLGQLFLGSIPFWGCVPGTAGCSDSLLQPRGIPLPMAPLWQPLQGQQLHSPCSQERSLLFTESVKCPYLERNEGSWLWTPGLAGLSQGKQGCEFYTRWSNWAGHQFCSAFISSKFHLSLSQTCKAMQHLSTCPVPTVQASE